MTWTIEFDPLAEKELKKLDYQQAKLILKFLFERVLHLTDPRSIDEALKGSRFQSLWKYRVGDHRLIVSIEDKITTTILIIKIGARKEVYRSK